MRTRERHQYSTSEKLIRSIRQNVFTLSEEKADQATRVLGYLKSRVQRDYKEIKTYEIHWRLGTRTTITGETFDQAFKAAGYDSRSLPLMSHYKEIKDVS